MLGLGTLDNPNLTLDANNKQRNVLLAFCNLFGDYTSAAQASIVL